MANFVNPLLPSDRATVFRGGRSGRNWPGIRDDRCHGSFTSGGRLSGVGAASDTAGFDRPAALTFSRQFDIAVDFDLEIDAADRNDRPRG
jgi:hypothetical protein